MKRPARIDRKTRGVSGSDGGAAASGRRRARRALAWLSNSWPFVGVILFGLLVVDSSHEQGTAGLSYDGASYLEVTRSILDEGVIPPFDSRPPLYPIGLAAVFKWGGPSPLSTLVSVQRALWIAAGVGIAIVCGKLARSRLTGLVAGCLYLSTGEAFDITQLVYAETLAIFLSIAALVALVLPEGRGSPWFAAGFALAAAWTRPINQLLLPLLPAVSFLGASTAGSRRRYLAAFGTAIGLGLLPVYLYHRVTTGFAYFVPLAGRAQANYLGDRRLLGHFPRELESIEAMYARRFQERPEEQRVPWWDVAGEWSDLLAKGLGEPTTTASLDAHMGSTTRAVLMKNLGYYRERWLEVWKEYSTSGGQPVRGPWSPISITAPWWATFWSGFGSWAPFALVLLESIAVGAAGGEATRLLPIVSYVLLSLANTAIEPWPGQVRYRTQFVGLLIAALALAPSGLMLLANTLSGRWRETGQ